MTEERTLLERLVELELKIMVLTDANIPEQLREECRKEWSKNES